jgi:hypothetical protein
MNQTYSTAEARRICEALAANHISLKTVADVAVLPSATVERQLNGQEPLEPLLRDAACSLLEVEKAKCLQKAASICLAEGDEKLATILHHLLEGDCVISAEWDEESIVLPWEA